MKLTRRLFVGRGAAAVGLVGISSSFVAGASIDAFSATSKATTLFSAAPGATVMFFDGQLWLDASGMGAPYRAPAGMRAAEPLACMADEELQCLYGRI